jgi:hypothetical protein
MQFDYRGSIVNTSQPVKVLRKVTKTLTIDSNDRDPALFVKVNGGATTSDAGDYVVYLPRVYEKVTKITLKSAMIQAPVVLSTSATTIGFQPTDFYILLGFEGLNRKDETAPGADRSGYVDSWFAKIANDVGVAQAGATIASAQSSGTAITYTTVISHGFFVGQTVCITGCSAAGANLAFVQVASVPSATTFTVTSTNSFNSNNSLTTSGSAFIPGTLYFNDATYDKQLVEYSPPLARLQRLHVTLRRHTPYSGIGTTTPLGAPIVFGAAQNSFTLEIEYLDNGFDDFSTMQTRLGPGDRPDAS